MDPTGLDSSVTTTHTLTDVAAGSYSVSVMAENENGMSQEMMATFVVQGMHVRTRSLAIYKLVDCAVCMLFCAVSGMSMLAVLYHNCLFKHYIIL